MRKTQQIALYIVYKKMKKKLINPVIDICICYYICKQGGAMPVVMTSCDTISYGVQEHALAVRTWKSHGLPIETHSKIFRIM